jgi:hypothetical protein
MDMEFGRVLFVKVTSGRWRIASGRWRHFIFPGHMQRRWAVVCYGRFVSWKGSLKIESDFIWVLKLAGAEAAEVCRPTGSGDYIAGCSRNTGLESPINSQDGKLLCRKDGGTAWLVDRVALRLCLPAQRAPVAWPRNWRTKTSAAPALRWAAEFSQRENCHHPHPCPCFLQSRWKVCAARYRTSHNELSEKCIKTPIKSQNKPVMAVTAVKTSQDESR